MFSGVPPIKSHLWLMTGAAQQTTTSAAARLAHITVSENLLEITTGRPATLAPRGMVTCPHSLASQAGVDVLRAGVSAVDAAIATSAALSVIYTHMVEIGRAHV